MVKKKFYNQKKKENISFYYLDGLGQLTDGQTGPDNREDKRGFQWVNFYFYKIFE
jgi:hypothetical protein